MDNRKLEYIEIWYDENKNVYKKLINKVTNIINDILENEKIIVNSVYGRVKEKDSYCNKASKDKYKTPVDEITDLAGIRIITYINSDVDKICRIIKEQFHIDEENSVDKGEELGTNKVGYRSVHYVAKIKEDRSNLPEYNAYKNLKFEVQIRTLLQHTWAEIEHDRNYKFSGVLPESIKRKFALVAGTLELIDMQFEEISKEIDSYSKEIYKNTQEGNLEGILIDSTSLNQYLLNRFDNEIKEKRIEPSFGKISTVEEAIINELRDFGIKTLDQLDSMLEKYTLNEIEHENYSGLLRDHMIVNDIEKYFSKCWNRHWGGFNSRDIPIMEKYNPDISDYLYKYDVGIIYE
ncbi:GTP pyrophosphokinase [Clostridium hydrogeniformans]|uniref:GTP pyrophosphokinase n=1 Tax=Clostridium hydrogeniformans TaxID=349933 RepID=UPI00068CC84C|nr:hypothetical protein [Clostridium hydrogeniformans]